MFIRHGLKNTIRSWQKSLLFFLLLAVLGATLCIGVSLTESITGFLRDCDETYTTVAVFEYVGVNYPDETRYDPDISQFANDFDFGAIENDPAVLNWDRNAVAFGSIAGKSAGAADAAYKHAIVAVVYILSYNEKEDCYQYTIVEDFLDPGAEPTGGYLYTDGVKLNTRSLYLVHGIRSSERGSYLYFRLSPFTSAAAAQAGVDGAVENMLVSIVSDSQGDYEVPADSVFYKIAETYEVINSGITVHAVNDLEAFLPFHQAELSIAKGRGFTQEEYISGAKVCMLPERLAELAGAVPGDRIVLSLAVQAGATEKGSYWAGTGFTYEHNYTVVGIITPNDDYRDTVFIPKSADTDLSANRYSFTLGQAKLKNDQAERFYLDILNVLPPRVRVTIYDQGYASVAAPLRDVLRIVLIVTAGCVLVTLAALTMFGFLFVYRQRDLARTMRRVGAPGRGVFSYFIFGSGCVALPGAALAAALSNKLSGFFMDIVHQTVANYAVDDLRYSNAALSITRTSEFAPKTTPAVFALTALSLFAAALLACLIFTAFSVRAHKHRRRPHSRRTGTVSRSLSGGALKYAWLSAMRGASRSALPVIVCALAAAFLLQLTGTSAAFEDNYDRLLRDTDISGYFTDYRGSWKYGLLVDGAAIHGVGQSGVLAGLSVTKTLHYGYGIKPPISTSPFAWETYTEKIAAGPGFIYTNDLSAVQEFYGCRTLPVTFIDGYDLSIFSYIPPGDEPVVELVNLDTWEQPERGVPPGIVSTAFLENNGLSPGDTIEVAAIGAPGLAYITFKVAGSFVKQGSEDAIYLPLSAYSLTRIETRTSGRVRNTFYTYIPSSYIFEPDAAEDLLRQLTFNSVSFSMRGADSLASFKDFLYGQGYSEVKNARAIRSFITIEDKTFLSTQHAVSQRLWYMQRVFPALYVLLELLAALIPFILIRLRKREAALMRVQGAPKHTVFFSLFFEQAILCVPGALIGAGVWLAFFRAATPPGPRLALLFALLWLLGTGISAYALNLGPVQKVLKAEE